MIESLLLADDKFDSSVRISSCEKMVLPLCAYISTVLNNLGSFLQSKWAIILIYETFIMNINYSLLF